ncbi:Acetylornithine deacetylase [Fundidesulfovibrio magnetotacticus]|uniref:Acetylornithine deacetylase n=1 Tax=Fundidesulfovibrio magnetotacticus TaxID=2730080 RepID=A0A6V8LKL0_9BACT|nr:M20/M25/M40 family metallo-hydrolase [Fundidesulfovibrio magnetotacticus]GFK93232.1 Acetylornithine deacetylase [Fundidesulfovibrio magnetotacticus]
MDALTREIVELTKALIRFPSTAADPGARKACADHIAATLDAWGIGFERLEHEGVESILALPEPGRCRVLLMAHYDVVAAPAALFEPREEDGKLFGRGAIDDKYAVALAMALLKRQKGQGGAMPLGVLLTGDEETGGRNGARHALQHVQAELGIALDGGSPRTLVTLQKGVIRFRLTARGKAAHGARPWMGGNAIEALMADLARVRALFTDDAPDHWHKTLNIGVIQGGTVVNMVPAEAWALLDIRHTEREDPEALKAAVRAAVRGELELTNQSVQFNGGDSPLLDLLDASVPGLERGRSHGATDARFLSERGIPGAVWGARGDGTQHTAGEYLHLDSLEELTASMARFLDSVPAK